MSIKKIIMIMSSLIAISCASTSISTINNPKYSSINIKRILVAVPFDDLELRKYAENEFERQLEIYNYEIVKAIDVMPPIQNYSAEETASILKSNNITGILIVMLTNAYSVQSYIPQSSSTTSNATIQGNSITGQSRTTTSGGYYVSKPRNSFEVTLYENSTGDIVWKATTNTSGNTWANNQIMITSLAQKIAEQMNRELSRK
jgi:hypothetical protein